MTVRPTAQYGPITGNTAHERHRAALWACSQIITRHPDIDPRNPTPTQRAETLTILHALNLTPQGDQ